MQIKRSVYLYVYSQVNDSRETKVWAFKWWCKLNRPILHFKWENQKRTLPNRDTPLWFKLVLISRCHQYTYKYTKEYAHLMEIPTRKFQNYFSKAFVSPTTFLLTNTLHSFSSTFAKAFNSIRTFSIGTKIRKRTSAIFPCFPWVPELFTPLHP